MLKFENPSCGIKADMSRHLFSPVLPQDECPFINMIFKVKVPLTPSHLPCDLFSYEIYHPHEFKFPIPIPILPRSILNLNFA